MRSPSCHTTDGHWVTDNKLWLFLSKHCQATDCKHGVYLNHRFVMLTHSSLSQGKLAAVSCPRHLGRIVVNYYFPELNILTLLWEGRNHLNSTLCLFYLKPSNTLMNTYTSKKKKKSTFLNQQKSQALIATIKISLKMCIQKSKIVSIKRAFLPRKLCVEF